MGGVLASRPIGGILLCFALLLCWAQLAFAQCSTNQGITSCSLSADFTTGGQSLFATGNGTVSFSGTVGTSWNQSGSVGSIVNVNVAGQNIGDYGAIFSGSTSGNISLSGSAVASGGNLSANVPVSLSLQLPSSVHPGDTFTVGSNYSYGSGVNFTTQSPTFGFGVAVGYDLQASLGVEACAGTCVGFSNTQLINTGQQTLTILQYNEAGSVQNPTVPVQGSSNANQLIALNQNVTSLLNSQLQGSKDIIPDVLALTYNASTTNLGFSSTGTAAGNGLYTASGQTANTVFGLDLNVVNALTSAAGLPPLSGSVGDLVCGILEVPCGSTLQNVLNSASYNILSADLTLGVSPSQQYSMSLNGATLGLQMYDQNGAAVGSLGSINADGTATLTYPTQAANGGAITGITISPVLTLADPTFTTQSGLTLVPGVDISSLGLGLGPSLTLGPLFDYSPSLPAIPQLTLNSTSFGLGGFSSETLGSTSAIAANSTLVNSSTISNNIDFQNLNATGQILRYSTLAIHDSNVTGGIFNGNANATATIAGDAAVPETLLSGVTFNLPASSSDNPALTTTGNVTFLNSTVTSSDIPSNVTVQANSGTLTFQNSTLTDQVLGIASGAAVVLSDSSLNGGFQNEGTLTLNNSVLMNAPNSSEPAFNVDGVINLNNGSTMHTGPGDTLFNSGGTINIGAGSLLKSDFDLAGGTINLAAGGTLTVSGTIEGTTTNAGGTINLNGANAQYMQIQNTAGAPGGTVNVSGSTTLNGVSMSGMALLNINPSARLDLEDTTINVTSVVNNGTLTGNNSTVTALSTLNNGTISVVGSGGNLNFLGNVANSASGLILAGNSQVLQFSSLSNQGGTINVQQSGFLTIVQQLTPVDNSQFTQISGNTVIDGTMYSTNTIKLEGGTLSGTGLIWGPLQSHLVENDGGFVKPGDNGGGGTLTIENSYTQGAGGTLSINIDSLTDFSQLVIESDSYHFPSTANLDGTLDVVLDADFLNQLESAPGGLASFLGTRFDIMEVGELDIDPEASINGMFSNLIFTDSNGDPLPFGYMWDVSVCGPYCNFPTDFQGQPASELILTFSTLPDCSNIGSALLNGTAVSGGCAQDFSPGDFSPSTFDFAPLDLTSSPEPGTLLLLASALTLGGAVARWRKLRYKLPGLTRGNSNKPRSTNLD
jgi:hypothetical protein